jgi:dolichyl-phosphate-mannose--protein O-mannosyl transferase
VKLPDAGWQRDLALALLMAAAAALVRLPRYSFPPEEVFDEVYHAKTALEYLKGQSPTEWVHPPTAKLLIAVPIYFLGYDSFAWRLAPALAGIAVAPVFFLLARQVLATPRAALLAGALLLCDGVYLVQSRIAMTNIFAVLFQLAAALFVVRALRHERLPWTDMTAAGVALGLALSTRWTSLWAAGFLGLVLLVARGRRLLRPRELALTLLAFLALPVVLYVASYVPWLRQGHALSELPEHQVAIWRYHADLRATHPYFSAWYTWPFLYRPTWYHYEQVGKTVYGIVAIGNPALWWASLPVTLWALISGARARDPRRLFSGAGFCFLYLPWGLAPRILNYNHYLFEAIPYACLSLGALLDAHWDAGSLARKLARGYLAVVVALFLFFLPVLMALPIPSKVFFLEILPGVRPWTWFPKWV